jgi:hypothetical protein
MGTTGGATAGVPLSTAPSSTTDVTSNSVSPAEPASSTGTGSQESGPANDLGPSDFVGEKPISTPNVSLGEISRKFKAEKNAHNVRVLSNEDAQKTDNPK